MKDIGVRRACKLLSINPRVLLIPLNGNAGTHPRHKPALVDGCYVWSSVLLTSTAFPFCAYSIQVPAQLRGLGVEVDDNSGVGRDNASPVSACPTRGGRRGACLADATDVKASRTEKKTCRRENSACG